MHRRRRVIVSALGIGVIAVVAWLYLRAETVGTAGTDDRAPVGDDGSAPAACNHPYVPLLRGTVWRYRVTAEVEATEAVVTGRVTSLRRISWTSEGAPPARRTEWSVVVRCGEDGAEEPWFGLLDGMLGSFSLTSAGGGTPTIDTRRWRLPRALSPGATFGGVAHLERPTSDERLVVDMERHYRVVSRQTISLYDGRVAEAWRLSFTDRQRADEHEAEWSGQLWLVEDVGLVRMEVAPGGHAITWELVDHRRSS